MGIPELLVLAASWLAPPQSVHRYHISDGFVLATPPAGFEYTMRWMSPPSIYWRQDDGPGILPTKIVANQGQTAPSKNHAQGHGQTSPVARTHGGVRARTKPLSY